MITGYEKPLYILPFDHRHSYITGVFHWREPLTPEQVAEIVASKQVIYDGFRAAVANSAVPDRAGILVDETFGAPLLRDAAARGYVTCVSTEKSGQDEFDFEYGAEFARHIETVNPTFAKVLVRYNPEADPQMNARQVERLRRLSDYLAGTRRLFMFELLVPPEPAQRADDYDTATRPGLVVAAIDELRGAGIKPDLWKIEGFERREDCATVAEHAGAPCVVLGRGADTEAVERWLRAGAGVFDGFAIGRSIWWDAARAYVAGSADRDATVTEIAERYGHFVDVFHAGA